MGPWFLREAGVGSLAGAHLFRYSFVMPAVAAGSAGVGDTTAYCVDIDPHAPYMYEWLNENPSAGPYVRIMRYGSTTLKSAVGYVEDLSGGQRIVPPPLRVSTTPRAPVRRPIPT